MSKIDSTTSDGRSPLDLMALAAAVAQDVATTHVRGAVDEAVRNLDTLRNPLDLEQHAVLLARTEDALDGIAFCALALAYKIVRAEAEGVESIPSLIEFMRTPIDTDLGVEELEDRHGLFTKSMQHDHVGHSVHVNLVKEIAT